MWENDQCHPVSAALDLPERSGSFCDGTETLQWLLREKTAKSRIDQALDVLFVFRWTIQSRLGLR